MSQNRFSDEEIEFLQQSNYIEGVWDSDSLDQAVKAWSYISTCKKLTFDNILKVHDILMKNHLGKAERGRLRQVLVSIGGRVAPAPQLLHMLLAEWLYQANHATTEEAIKEAHVRYEWIHPFIDGNGRTGRIFLNWSRVKNNLPILVIAEEEKWDYYKWFR